MSPLSEAETLRKEIHEANIAVHRVEASYYRMFHPEIYSRQEQKRVTAALQQADQLVTENRRRALDFGAGIGNLTDKLLELGYTVTAVDISAEMCQALRGRHPQEDKAGRLIVVNSPIEDVDFEAGQFDLVTCYSVLHHLPDYEAALRKLCTFVKHGGVMFLDHEASANFWKPEHGMLAQLVKSANFHSNPMLNTIYFSMVGLKLPTLDYTVSDYWFKREHHVNHTKIKRIFEEQNFSQFQRTDYFSRESWIINPISLVYRQLCRPDTSLWIAKK